MSQVPSNPTGIPKSRLPDRVRDAIRVRRCSIRTEEAYVQWIRRFILFHDKRRPNEMGETETSGFSSHPAVENKVSSSTRNQALCTLIFLYKEAPHREIFLSKELVRAKKPKKLPVVLIREEVRSVLDGLNGCL